MAYSPPNSFTNGTALTATAIDGNDQALRVYLHDSVVDADLLSSTPWVETQHIQSPVVDPIRGLQHGVTGWQGSQWSGGFGVRAQFASIALTGDRTGSTECFEVLPQTAFTLELRHPALVIFHWWMETFNGPDDNVDPTGDASLYVGEYKESEQYATGRVIPTQPAQALISSNNRGEWAQVSSGALPERAAGPYHPYTISGLGNLSGTVMQKVDAGGGYTVGLSHLTSIDPSCIINWSIHMEAYYTGVNLTPSN